MANFKSAALPILLGLLLVSLGGSLRAAPDNRLGMALMAAFVASDGALIRGSGVTSAAKLGTGSYLVQFDRPVSLDDPTGCFFVGNSYFQDVIVTPTRQPPNGVSVATKSAGNFVDASFYLLVYCAR